MSAIVTHTDPRHPTPGDVLHMLTAWLAAHSTGARRLAEVRRLETLSDQELARRGLRRGAILRHVFGRNCSN